MPLSILSNIAKEALTRFAVGRLLARCCCGPASLKQPEAEARIVQIVGSPALSSMGSTCHAAQEQIKNILASGARRKTCSWRTCAVGTKPG